MSVDVTLTSYILNPWTTGIGYHGGTSNLIALSYANLDFTPSASDPYKSTSGDVFKVYVNGVRIYRQSDQDYAGGSGFLEAGDTSGQTLNGVSAAWTATSNTVWEINTALQLILLNVDSVAATTLYGSGGLNVSFATSSTAPIIELRRAVQDLKTPAIDFSNASILTEQDLDNSAKNVFHVSQQAVISTENAMLYDSGTDTYKATQPGTSNAKRISNVSAPSAGTDAANKSYVDGSNSTQTVAGAVDAGHISAIAGEITPTNNISTVAGKVGDIEKVAHLEDGTTATSAVSKVAGKEAEIGRLGATAYSDGANAYLAKLGVDSMSNATTGNIKKVADIDDKVIDVAGKKDEVGLLGVAGVIEDMGHLGTSANVTAMGHLGTSANVTNMSNLTATGVVDDLATLGSGKDGKTSGESNYDTGTNTNISQINTVASSIGNVNTFANTYHTPSSSEPSSNVTEGDLWYDTSNNTLMTYNGSSWEDLKTTAGGNTITSSSGSDLSLVTPSNSNKVVINSGSNTIQLPNVRASQDNYVLAMSDTSTGETAWQVTQTAPTITSITSGQLNSYYDVDGTTVSNDKGGTLVIAGTDFGTNISDITAVRICASDGTSQISATTVGSLSDSGITATWNGTESGYSTFSGTYYVEVVKSGMISNRFNSTKSFSADPTISSVTGTGGEGESVTVSSSDLGTYGGQIDGGGQDSNTKLLLNFDRGGGTDIEDSSNTGGDGHKVTATNNAIIKSSPFGDGKSAMYFDGSDDKITADNHADFSVAAEAWSIDYWVCVDTSDAGGMMSITNISSNSPTESNSALVLYQDSSNPDQLHWYMDDDSTSDWDMTSAGTGFTFDDNLRWHHIALAYGGSSDQNYRLFVDGRLIKTHSSSATMQSSSGNQGIVFGTNQNAGAYFKGYIDEIRWVKGENPFPTTTFAPSQYRYGSAGATHEVQNNANMKLLIHSNRTDEGNTTFTDSSTSAQTHTITGTGGAKHSKLYGGIAPAMTWPASKKATGSAGVYFDGDGDYLEIPYNAELNYGVASQAYSIDMWIYPTEGDTSNGHALYMQGTGSSNRTLLFYYGTNGLTLYTNSGSASINISTSSGTNTSIPLNQWSHIALTRDTSGVHRIYINGKYQVKATDNESNGLTSNYFIGKHSYSSGSEFKGYIDGVRFQKGVTLYSSSESTTNAYTLPTKTYGAYFPRNPSVGTITITGATTDSTDIAFTEINNTLPNGLTLNDQGAGNQTATITGTLTDSITSDTTTSNIRIQAKANADDKRITEVNESNGVGAVSITKKAGGAPVLFNARRFMGNATQRDINGFGFAPDLVWVKNRDAAEHHRLFDTVRGAKLPIISNDTYAQDTQSAMLNAFNADGFSVGNDNINTADQAIIAWGWKAGGAPTATNDNTSGAMDANSVSVDGTLQSSYTPSGSPSIYPMKMSVNTTGGFSIVTYNGVRSSAGSDTIPHGLGSAPDLIIVKRTDSAQSWSVGHSSTNLQASSGFLELDTSDALDTSWDDFGASPDANVFTTQYSNRTNTSGGAYVAYCFKSVSGVSAFGTYTGNAGSKEVDFPNSETFTPKFIMIKSLSAGEWFMYDTFRGTGTSGQTDGNIFGANDGAAENWGASQPGITVNSGGWTMNTTNTNINGSDTNYIYMAFA